ncbi:MAG: APC family permease [Chloroflexi bacterium]|nr:APC family permease [Chloroflexota bacterium]
MAQNSLNLSQKISHSWQHFLIGRPLATADAPHQTIGKTIGLAVFASDALSSSAYSTQEMLVILAAAGTASFGYATPLTLGIIALLTILTLSYEQTIHAYTGGGGAYIVARDNLGELPAEIAAAALLIDYILTVSVSISSGVAQITSISPDLYPYRALIAVLLIGLIMIMNLRGVKESGRAFSIPTYYFILMMIVTIVVGFIRYLTGTLGTVSAPPQDMVPSVVQPITFFLLLKAFASGTSAVTGVEAISNGVTAFKEPRSKNAGQTLIWMAVILGIFLLGVASLSLLVGALPSENETVFSQIARTVFDGRGVMYVLMLTATTVILVMAANTAFADFPRLGAIAATDGFLPRQFTYRGSRLVYSYGIAALAGISSLLVIIFQASVTRLIPLYAIGVFLSFTLSQTGMAHRWWKSGHLKPDEAIRERGSILSYDRRWKFKMVLNSIGALTTLVVMFSFALIKFKDGAWLIVILVPLLVMAFSSIHRHYERLASQLSLENNRQLVATVTRNRVIILISGVHQGTLSALRFARTLSKDITAVHVSIDPDESEKIKAKWNKWGDGIRLVVLNSPYRLLIEPLMEYLDKLEAVSSPGEIITLVVPQFVPQVGWTKMLHMRTSETLRKVLLNRPNIIIIEVPYQVK